MAGSLLITDNSLLITQTRKEDGKDKYEVAQIEDGDK